MAAIDTAALRALADAATPGPWQEINEGDGVEWSVWNLAPAPESDGEVTGCGLPEADATFIAAARQAVPALCDEVDRLRAEVEQVEATNATSAAFAESFAGRWAEAVAERDEARAALDRVRALAESWQRANPKGLIGALWLQGHSDALRAAIDGQDPVVSGDVDFLATCGRCGRGMNPGDAMCCPSENAAAERRAD